MSDDVVSSDAFAVFDLACAIATVLWSSTPTAERYADANARLVKFARGANDQISLDNALFPRTFHKDAEGSLIVATWLDEVGDNVVGDMPAVDAVDVEQSNRVVGVAWPTVGEAVVLDQAIVRPVVAETIHLDVGIEVAGDVVAYDRVVCLSYHVKCVLAVIIVAATTDRGGPV